MIKIDITSDLDLTEKLWRKHWPRDGLFDLWPVRECFQREYRHDSHCLVATRNGRFGGMLALSRLDGEKGFGHFPGETWQGKTWLEQNRVVAADSETAGELVAHIPPGTRIRYLHMDDRLHLENRVMEDETGYLFFPRQYHFSFDAYWNTFSGKTRKKLNHELKRFRDAGVRFREDCLDDVDWMLRRNLESFRERSYFYDPRFLRAFQSLSAWLASNGLLRVTTVLIGGRVAAVDMGAVWNGGYTVLAGGTHEEFPGVAKLINLHHLEWACARRLEMVDFLCGDFNWKQRFHLTPRRLFQIWRPRIDHRQPAGHPFRQAEIHDVHA